MVFYYSVLRMPHGIAHYRDGISSPLCARFRFSCNVPSIYGFYVCLHRAIKHLPAVIMAISELLSERQ